jgi:hypothetical protein
LDVNDDACAEQIISSYGRQLLRRPLAAAEIAQRVDLAGSRTVASGDFYAGIELVLVSLLVAEAGGKIKHSEFRWRDAPG